MSNSDGFVSGLNGEEKAGPRSGESSQTGRGTGDAPARSGPGALFEPPSARGPRRDKNVTLAEFEPSSLTEEGIEDVGIAEYSGVAIPARKEEIHRHAFGEGEGFRLDVFGGSTKAPEVGGSNRSISSRVRTVASGASLTASLACGRLKSAVIPRESKSRAVSWPANRTLIAIARTCGRSASVCLGITEDYAFAPGGLGEGAASRALARAAAGSCHKSTSARSTMGRLDCGVSVTNATLPRSRRRRDLLLRFFRSRR